MTQEIALTGIKPTGTPHIGNLFGAIQPAIAMAKSYSALYFIADYHALTTVRNQKAMQEQIRQVAATWLAAGLNPDEVIFYRQSAIPEVFEFTWVLSCLAPKGLMNRAHSYKDAVAKNEAKRLDSDKGVNMGLYNYPVLMAADILLYSAHKVPVGQDQKQHLEIARDIAQAFNQSYGELLVLPEPIIQEAVQTIPGIDGRKMSKSYDNVIPLYLPPKDLKKRINQIVTDSKGVDEPKDAESCNLFQIFKLFATPQRIAEVELAYTEGGLGYGHLKAELFELLDTFVAPGRKTYTHYLTHPQELDRILAQGAKKARAIAQAKLKQVRQAIGMDS